MALSCGWGPGWQVVFRAVGPSTSSSPYGDSRALDEPAKPKVHPFPWLNESTGYRGSPS